MKAKGCFACETTFSYPHEAEGCNKHRYWEERDLPNLGAQCTPSDNMSHTDKQVMDWIQKKVALGVMKTERVNMRIHETAKAAYEKAAAIAGYSDLTTWVLFTLDKEARKLLTKK